MDKIKLSANWLVITFPDKREGFETPVQFDMQGDLNTVSHALASSMAAEPDIATVVLLAELNFRTRYPEIAKKLGEDFED